MRKQRIKLTSGFRYALFLLVVLLGIILLLNAAMIRETEAQRIEADGQMKLSSIAGRVDNSLYRAECLLDSVALQVEQITLQKKHASSALTEFFSDTLVNEIYVKSDGSCFSAYAAHGGRLYINGFVPDEDFVLEERSWYVGAKERRGNVYVTDPYIDANTGELCYSISKLLPDGSTVVGMDFNFTVIQNYIEEMSLGSQSTSMIVNGDGTILGHTNPSFVGQNYKSQDILGELVNKVFMLYGDTFTFKSGQASYIVFSEKTNNDWYLIVCVKNGAGNHVISGQFIYLILFMVLLAVITVFFFVHLGKSKIAAEQALSARDEFLENMSAELKVPLSRIRSRAEILGNTQGQHSAIGEEIEDSAKELGQKIDNLLSMSAILDEENHETVKTEGNRPKLNHKWQMLLISMVLAFTSIFAIALNTNTQLQWGNTKMQKETELYLHRVQEWVDKNRTVLDVIGESIAAQEGFGADYDYAVDYLNSIATQYDDISVVYLCNPDWEHTVLMNNRWEPSEGWHVEERQWYVDTLASEHNFCVADPYLDEQTGLYCTTLSKVVYDNKGNFIGLLGIDYYLDKLVDILGESHTDAGYAFLTDINGSILNHPNLDYQMKPDYSVMAADLCYRKALSQDVPAVITDYDNSKKVCLAMVESTSGLNVIVVKRFSEIYGSCIVSDILYALAFALCIVVINIIMSRISRWQERVNRELQEAAESAISAGKAKNDFLANMSHEIRTPINAVLGMNEMIMRETKEEKVLEYASVIRSSGKSLLSIINDILDFSKIESGKMEIVAVEYEIGTLMDDLINMIKPRAEKKNLHFFTEIDANIPRTLYGDDVRLKQIITNILTNAIKYTQEGSVTLKVKLVEVNEGIAKMEISVSDTGIGIKEEDLDKLFTSFQRLDQERNRNIEGTGLGITIVQRLLRMMDSELNVSSIYGVGSTFSFAVCQKVIDMQPMGELDKLHRNVNKEENKIQIMAPGAKVLVVDDNKINLKVACGLMKPYRMQLLTAESGPQAIEMLKEGGIDLVFMDHMMPEMDGVEATQTIRQLEGEYYQKLPIIALTANAVAGVRDLFVAAGMNDFLAKPIEVPALDKMLRSWLPQELIQERTE